MLPYKTSITPEALTKLMKGGIDSLKMHGVTIELVSVTASGARLRVHFTDADGKPINTLFDGILELGGALTLLRMDKALDFTISSV